jgi:hypothetical protein
MVEQRYLVIKFFCREKINSEGLRGKAPTFMLLFAITVDCRKVHSLPVCPKLSVFAQTVGRIPPYPSDPSKKPESSAFPKACNCSAPVCIFRHSGTQANKVGPDFNRGDD